jgi:hypothetical protein
MDGKLRDQLRSSVNHNTLTIDGVSSSIPNGPFHWESRANAELDVARCNSRFALFEARHDGYRVVGHRRVVMASGLGYLVADQVIGDGRHEGAQHWHFDPAWTVSCESPHALRMTHTSGSVAWLAFDGGEVSLFTGDNTESLGWFSPAYGVRVPSWTARVTHTLTAPWTAVSWCGVTASGVAPSLERIPCASDATGAAIAVRMSTGGIADALESVTILCPGDLGDGLDRSLTADRITTDARALQCAFVGGRMSAVSLADGSRAVIAGTLTVTAGSPMTDLHISCSAGRLDLTATAPPPTLRLQGEAVTGVERVTVNGRELRRAAVSGDVVVVTAPDWAGPPSTLSLQDSHDVRNSRVR